MAAYNADFAAEWGQKVRDILESCGQEFFGIKVRQDRRASDNWGIVGHDGGMQTTGIGGALTGRGADLLLIDDPVKDAEEALSPTMRQRAWDWYASAASTRVEPGGAICLTMTPWHAGDLGGLILEQEGHLWDILRFPALAEEPIEDEVRLARKGYDRLLGAPDPLGRQPGEALWPARYDEDYYREKSEQDPFWYDALYQCHPRPRDGGFFKREWFDGKVIAVPHRECRYIRFWDKASSVNKGDWTVGVLMGERNGMYYIVDVQRFRLAPGDRDMRMRDVSVQDKARYGEHGYEIWVEQEAGGGGKSDAEATVKLLAGFKISVEARTKGNKESGAAPLASQCQAGNVKLVAGHWLDAFLDELTGFPNGKHDDQVDAASGAFNKLAIATCIPSEVVSWAAYVDPYADQFAGAGGGGAW